MLQRHLLLLLCSFALFTAPAGAQDKKHSLQELIQKLQTGNDTDKFTAAAALADLGSEAAPAVPALVKSLQVKSEDVRLNAAIALGKIGAPAVGPVAKLLAEGNVGDRYYAISTLGWIGPAAKNTAPQILAAVPLSRRERGRGKGEFLGFYTPCPRERGDLLDRIMPPEGRGS